MAALLDDTMPDEETIVRRAVTPVSRRSLLSPFNWAADSVALLADLDPTVRRTLQNRRHANACDGSGAG